MIKKKRVQSSSKRIRYARYSRLFNSNAKRQHSTLLNKRKRRVPTTKTAALTPAVYAQTTISELDQGLNSKSYEEAYNKGFNTGFAQGFEDGNQLGYKS